MSTVMLDLPVPPGASPSRRAGGAVLSHAATAPIGPRAHLSVVDRAHASDAALLAQARAGDAAAFEIVYDRHAAVAYGLARRMLHNPTAAQDVVQEAFLSLWRTDSYRPEKGSLRNFVLGIVRNRAIDALRKERRRKTDELSDDSATSRLPAAERTDVEVEQRDTHRLLRAALTTLPDAQHQALELAFFDGLTHAEIALRLNEPIGTIKSRIRLGLQRLRTDTEAIDCR
jgi:RNA polymerase sigma-70 factor, ECF subfamily